MKGLAIIFFLIMIPFSIIQLLFIVFKLKIKTVLKWIISVGVIIGIITLYYSNFNLLAWITALVILIIPLGLNNYFKSNKKFPIYFLVFVWLAFIGGSGILYLSMPFLNPMKVKKENLYGTYEIIKDKFDKKQSEWQHNNFELEITNNSILKLYKLKPQKKIIDSVSIKIVESSVRSNFVVKSDSLTHHIIKNSPTLFRKRYNNFYLVFKSDKYHNMFFKKK